MTTDIDLSTIRIEHGSHKAPLNGETHACVMEWAYLLDARRRGLSTGAGLGMNPSSPSVELRAEYAAAFADAMLEEYRKRA